MKSTTFTMERVTLSNLEVTWDRLGDRLGVLEQAYLLKRLELACRKGADLINIEIATLDTLSGQTFACVAKVETYYLDTGLISAEFTHFPVGNIPMWPVSLDLLAALNKLRGRG
jgi:hypothetical protein